MPNGIEYDETKQRTAVYPIGEEIEETPMLEEEEIITPISVTAKRFPGLANLKVGDNVNVESAISEIANGKYSLNIKNISPVAVQEPKEIPELEGTPAVKETIEELEKS